MKKYRIEPDTNVRLKDYDPDDKGHFRHKEQAQSEMPKILSRLDILQNRLYAESRRSLLIVLQGMDTAGKDGVIRHVMSGVNPQSCRVVSFKEPTHEELAHDFLWRVHKEAPSKGFVSIFNRSHYEDVLVTRVHGQVSRKVVEKRFKEINHFEKLLAEADTTILKFFLHISKDEQRDRLIARLKHPEKRWKFSMKDIEERKYWKDYRKAYEESISATSTKHAPWYIIPSNHTWYRNWAVARIILDALEGIDPQFPPPKPGIHYNKIKVL